MTSEPFRSVPPWLASIALLALGACQRAEDSRQVPLPSPSTAPGAVAEVPAASAPALAQPAAPAASS